VSQNKKSKFPRTGRDLERALSEHTSDLASRMTIQDWLRLGMFGAGTFVLKEAKFMHWEPLWAKPTPRQEALNWATNAIVAYLMIYHPQAVASAFGATLKGLTGFLGAIM